MTVFGGKIRFFGQKFVGTAADRDPALKGVRLSFFIEGHHEDRRAA